MSYFPKKNAKFQGDITVDADPPAGDNDQSFATTEWVQTVFGNPSNARPFARVQRNTDQTGIATATDTTINFDTEIDDTDNMVTISGTTDRITFTTAGNYIVTGLVELGNNATGVRKVWIEHRNSAGTLQRKIGYDTEVGSSAVNFVGDVADEISVAAGDYIQLRVHQTSGGNLTATAGGNVGYAASLSAGWVGNTGAAWGNAGARVSKSANQSLSASTEATLTFDTEEFDTDSMHDTVTNNSRITINTPGLYEINAVLELDGATTDAYLYVRKNGSTGTKIAEHNSGTTLSCSGHLLLNAGDYIEVRAFTATARNANTNTVFSALRAGYQSPGDGPPLVSTLPTSPVDGQEIYYQSSGMATDGIVWHLRYRSGGGTYKWEYLGGGSLYNETTTGGTVNNGSYAACTNAGPTVTVPLAGDYLVEIGCHSFNANAGVELRMSYDIGGTGAVDADSLVFGHDTANSRKPMHGRARKKTISSAATTLTAKYRNNGGGNATFEDRWMKATPLHVG